ncbi:MAG: helix-turn-helix domain-containing protein, partial [Planctomycetaceae bacterium]
MAKKYLTLEEAAGMLGISEDDLKKARENGQLRGFADRGNWKFREEDITEYGRTQSADSSPDVPLMSDPASGSVLGDEDGISEQPTEIRKHSDDATSDDGEALITDADEGASDSGVRMVLDDSLLEGDSSEESPPLLSDSDGSGDIALQLGDSDSEMGIDDADVSSVEIPLQLEDSEDELGLQMGEEGASSDHQLLSLDDSDSDVKLTSDPIDDSLGDSSEEVLLTGQDSDSDVRLLDKTMPMVDMGSDSDVRLIKTDSDSNVQLVGSNSDSDVRLLSPAVSGAAGHDVSLDDAVGDTEVGISLGDVGLDNDDSVLSLDEDSRIALAEDSGISLEGPMDSGIALDVADDSGIALDVADDSGIALDVTDDSGIALDTGDSDISLDEGLTLDTSGDSGLSLDAATDSGISLDGDFDATAPVMQFGDDVSTDSATMVAIPSLDDGDSESDFELGALEGDSSSDTSVLLFDDEDDADDRAATMIRKGTDDQEETFDLDAGEAFDEDFEDDDDLLGEDDEIEDFADDDSFMADDEAFDEDSFETDSRDGGSVTVVAAAEQEWGVFMFATVLVSSVTMLFCCGVLFDLVRYS